MNESGLLQQFLYALSIPQGDKRWASIQRNLTNTANTADYLIICLLTRLSLATNTAAKVAREIWDNMSFRPTASTPLHYIRF